MLRRSSGARKRRSHRVPGACLPLARPKNTAHPHRTTAHSRARRDKKEATAKQRKFVSAALKSERFPSELLSQLPTAGWGVPSQPKRSAKEDAEAAAAERKSKRGRKRQPEVKPGMPTVFKRSHNLEVAVAPRSNTFGHGADLQAFLQEQLYGSGVKRIASTSFSSLTRAGACLRTSSRAWADSLAYPPYRVTRAGAAGNFATAAPPPNRVTKPKKEKVDPATKLTGRVMSASSTAMERRAAKLMRG